MPSRPCTGDVSGGHEGQASWACMLCPGSAALGGFLQECDGDGTSLQGGGGGEAGGGDLQGPVWWPQQEMLRPWWWHLGGRGGEGVTWLCWTEEEKV